MSIYLLKRHPIAVESHFDFVLVLTYAFPPDLLRPLLSPGLSLDTFGNRAFVAVAIVHTTGMRPKGWPALFSQDYMLIGYRIFVRYRTNEGRRLRGLKILRSDASKASVVFSGNMMTHYNFKLARIEFQHHGQSLRVRSAPADGITGLDVTAALDAGDDVLPEHSPFECVRDALKFAGPMPFTFDYEGETNSIIRVEGVRENWHPKSVSVEVAKIDFFKQQPFCQIQPILCSSFYIKGVPYWWKPGIAEKIGLNGAPSENPDADAFGQSGELPEVEYADL